MSIDFTAQSRRGRPRGRSPRQLAVQADIAAGMQPLAAFAKHGFRYPDREVKRQAAVIAEAAGFDPLDVCRNIAKYGSDDAKVTACAVLLTHASPSANATNETHSGGHVIIVPLGAPADFVEREIERRENEHKIDRAESDDFTFAKGVLTEICSNPRSRDFVAVRAAKTLLSEHATMHQPKAAASNSAPYMVFLDNGRALSEENFDALMSGFEARDGFPPDDPRIMRPTLRTDNSTVAAAEQYAKARLEQLDDYEGLST